MTLFLGLFLVGLLRGLEVDLLEDGPRKTWFSVLRKPRVFPLVFSISSWKFSNSRYWSDFRVRGVCCPPPPPAEPPPPDETEAVCCCKGIAPPRINSAAAIISAPIYFFYYYYEEVLLVVSSWWGGECSLLGILMSKLLLSWMRGELFGEVSITPPPFLGELWPWEEPLGD